MSLEPISITKKLIKSAAHSETGYHLGPIISSNDMIVDPRNNQLMRGICTKGVPPQTMLYSQLNVISNERLRLVYSGSTEASLSKAN